MRQGFERLAAKLGDSFPFSPARHQSDPSFRGTIVFIVKENRSFDSMFGTFPGANGATSGLMSTGQLVQLGRMPDALPTGRHAHTLEGGDMPTTPALNPHGE